MLLTYKASPGLQLICTIIPGGKNVQFVLLIYKALPDLQVICTIIPGGKNLLFVLLTHKASPDLQIICIIIPPVSKPCTKLCTVTTCVMKYAIRIIKHLKPSGNYMYHLLYNIYNSSFFTHNVFDCPLLFKQTVTSCKTTTLTSCKTTTVTSCKTTRVTSCKTTRVTSCKTTTVTFALCSGY